MQPLKYAVSFIIYRNGREFLVVKRPGSDEEFPNLWGLPATGFDPRTESPDEAAVRGAREKLGCGVGIIERMPLVLIQRRRGYDLLLIDYKCMLKQGEPDVGKAGTSGTAYTEQKWTDDPSILEEIAGKGSICAQIFLNRLGRLPQDRFLTRL